MNLSIKIFWLPAALIILFLTACSQHIPIESVAAEEAINRAYNSGASRTAPEKYKLAEQTLEQGKRLIEEGKDEKAREVLLDAINKGHTAEIATYQKQLDLTEEQLDAAEEYILRLEAQRNIYFESLSNIYDEKKLSEIQIAGSNKSLNPSSSYRVRRGENLFAIAARRQVYSDSLLWPLIYKANRDQIKDPQQIYPGQVLTIPRDVSEQEMEEARNIARESKIFPQPAATGGK